MNLQLNKQSYTCITNDTREEHTWKTTQKPNNLLFYQSMTLIHYNSTKGPTQCIKVIQREAHK